MSKKSHVIAPDSLRGRFQEAAMRAIYPVRNLKLWILIALFALSVAPGARAQDEQRTTKVPLIGNVSGGTNRQAFSGKVQAVDPKRKLLIMDSVEGSHTEFFPVKGNFEVSAPGGKKTHVSELTPGMSIIIYYQVKSDRREVTDILILGSKTPDKEPESKKPAAPS
jgi:hypothetical protein